MTTQEAAAMGYEVIKASPYEFGLIKNGQGIRTWWNNLDGKLPGLDHPSIQKAIEINESNHLPSNPDRSIDQG